MTSIRRRIVALFLSQVADRVRQWLGAVPAARAWAARRSLPLVDSIVDSVQLGQRQTA